MRRFLGGALTAALLAMATMAPALAHKSSDSYLSLCVKGKEITGQWDIALRDLDFVLKLDDDGDGNITWSELRRHQADITAYAFDYLKVSTDRGACSISPGRQMVDSHADGAYAALFFDIVCVGAATTITLDYRLFFAIDPSHRGILVLHSGNSIATSLLSPENARIELNP